MRKNYRKNQKEAPSQAQERKLITLCFAVGFIMLAALLRRML